MEERRTVEGAVTETVCPDSTGWNAETMGSSFCRTARIYQVSQLTVQQAPIVFVQVRCGVLTSVGVRDTTFGTLAALWLFRCFEKGVSARRKGWTERTKSLAR